MPANLSLVSFGFQDSDRDRITMLAGTLVYSTSNTPPTSASSTAAGGGGRDFVIPWFDDVTAGRFEPSAEECWFHFQYYTALNNANNDTLAIGLGSDDDEFITISAEDSTNKLTIRLGTLGVLATATTDAFSISTWTRVHVHVEGVTAGDTISVYLDGDLSTPVVTHTLSGGEATVLAGIGSGLPNGWYVTLKTGDTNGLLDDMAAWDPTDAAFPGIEFLTECSIKEQVFTSDGAESDWSGAYTDIDEIPPSDTDKRTAAAVGDQFSGLTAAIGEPNVFGVKVLARCTRTGTDAGANITIRSNDGTNTEDFTMAAPGDGDIQAIFDEAPDATAWSPTKRDATRWGFEAQT